MIVARVIGNVWSTRKDKSLQGYKFLVVKPLYNDKDSFVAVDGGVGAGLGDHVLVVSGSSARVFLEKKKEVPIDATIVGVVDKVETGETEL